MMKGNLLKLYESSFKSNWDLPALSDFNSGKAPLRYSDLAEAVARLHLFFQESGVKRGDKIALLGRNNTSWVVVYIATLTYGAIVVPILAEFNANDAMHIINHSDSEILFVSNSIWDHLEFERLSKLRMAISLDNNKMLAERDPEQTNHSRTLRNLQRRFRMKYRNGFTPADVSYPDLPKDSVAVINYTSGTTGFSKGVMLTLNNLCGNAVFGIQSRLHYEGSRCLAFLPLAHAYGGAFDMLIPLLVGTHVTIFTKPPTPHLLIRALKEVKPNLVLCVPLILEKIYRKQIVPMITKRPIRWALAIPLIDGAIFSKIRKKLVDAFGGNFEEVIVGGAPLNPEVEDFLYKIKFPFTVGYGMTECGPLISYTPWREFVPHSCGRTLPIMESKIESDDPENIPGGICVRGENLMKGYYKNPKATAEAIDKDGWLHTGDMGTRSADGTLFIKGRLKTMILNASGQNIYPEEIEAKLNNMPYVNESLVVERGKGLTALVYPDYDRMDAEHLTTADIAPIMEQNREELNTLVAPYERIAAIQLVPNEFEKTPKRSIKRFLYS